MHKGVWKNIIRVVCVVAAVLFFCPQFLISCSGETMELNMLDVTCGLEADGTTITNPHLIVALLLLFPIGIFIVTIVNKKDKITGLCAAGIGLICLIMQFIIKGGVSNAASDYVCTSRAIWGFYLSVFSDLVLMVSGAGLFLTAEDLPALSAPKPEAVRANPVPQEPLRTCPKCGNTWRGEAAFCTNCGAPYQEPEAKPGIVCPVCGKEAAPDAVFCENCGQKLL